MLTTEETTRTARRFVLRKSKHNFKKIVNVKNQKE